MSMDLSKQVAAITGGLGDIGRAIALNLAHHGADIALCDIRPASDSQVVLDEIHALGRRAIYHKVDVTDAEQVADWVDAIGLELGLPGLIIPNAAVVTLAPSSAMTPAQWSRDIRVNLDGAFYFAQACASRLLAAKRRGRIVFIGSWAAHAPHVQGPAYCASKAAIRMLCKVMALELAPAGILVNEVAPGYVDGGLTGKIWSENPASRVQARADVPTQQLISAEEVAFQVACLCDPNNRHMTGTTILMDGGLSLTNVSINRRGEK